MRDVWIRKGEYGVVPKFSWRPPSEILQCEYDKVPIHVSHVSDLRVREAALEQLRKELLALEREFDDYLLFLREHGAQPVDMVSTESKMEV